MTRRWFLITVLLSCAVLAAAEEEPVVVDWNAYVYAGLAVSRGNTTKDAYNYGGAFSRKLSDRSRCFVRVDGRYSKMEDYVSESKTEVEGEVQRVLSGKWFVSGVLSFRHDDLKEIRYRTKLGPGIGYYLVDTDEMTADVGMGLVYDHEKTEMDTSNFIAWRVSQHFTWKLTDTLDFWSNGEFLMSTRNASDFTATIRVGLNTRLSKHLGLVVTVEDVYDNLLDGSPVAKNDFQLSTALRYTF